MEEKTDLSPADPSAEILEPVESLADVIDSQETGTSAGTPDASSEAEVQHAEQPQAQTTLISELNDVSLTTTNNDAETFLESLTAENPAEACETQISSDVDEAMPSLEMPMAVNEDDAEKEKPMLENENKDPVCSLEEELKRMHEGDSQSNEPEDIKPDFNAPVTEDIKSENEDKDKSKAPIMKDSDLEEMLSADEVIQDPLAIKASQHDVKKQDILVCGTCHDVFYFIEEFQSHKAQVCTKKSAVTQLCEFEGKAQIWAYALWKNKQAKLLKEEDEGINEWELYKKWSQLGQVNKDAWVSAGEMLQHCNKIGNAKLTEMKIPKTNIKDEDKDPLSLDGLGDSNKENSTFETSKSPLLEVKRTVINKPKAVPTSQKMNNDPNSNRAMRTVQAQKCEFVVERIVAKRFNPKKKTWEYQIKWENFGTDENTWEPLANLNHCRQMVDEFEEQLKKLKAEKAKQQAAANAIKGSTKIKSAVTSPGSSNTPSKGLTQNRPQRTSKQKALDQVKAWCGNISDEDGNPNGMKRSRSPDSDESYEKRMKLDENSDDSEPEIKPKVQYRKIAPKPTTPIQILKNGMGKNTPLPQNILIPDANGVVRINQKQLPSLSTGVYIMSKTAGIIKLDSNTSKVATSGGQTIVKVAPKIGQTQIKIMKKDGTTTQQIVQMSPTGMQNTPKAMQKHLIKAKKIVSDLKPSPIVKKTSEVVKKQPVIITPKDHDKKPPAKKLADLSRKSSGRSVHHSGTDREDESDDGLEELPFPDEIKVPEPEENEESDFVLDPSTGKIAGVEYPDVPDPEPIEEPKSSEMSLDNIVKLAAADITEDDLKNEPQDSMDEMQEVGLEQEESEFDTKVKLSQKTEPQKRFVTASPMKQVVKMSVTPRKVTANPTSILNKALTGPHVVRRNIAGTTAQPRVQQRILNQSVARSPQMMNPVVRQVNTYIRTKPVAPKPRFNIASDSKFIRSVHETSAKNVYTYARPIVQNSSARKIGSTTIRSSSMPVVNSQQQKQPQTRLVRTSTGVVQRIISPVKKEQPMSMMVRGQPEKIERKIVQTKPKTVISMPSLMSDDEILITAKKVKQTSSSEEQAQEYQMEEGASSEGSPGGVIESQESEENIAGVQEQAVATLAPDMSSFTLADNENPIFITGDDGTVYQVAGQNEQGQTILLTQGSDGQQQCLLVTNEVAEAMDSSSAEESQDTPQEISMPDIAPDVTEPLSVKTDPAESNDQVVAQVVRAEPPSPGGTHKVVVMLPDGNLMVTQVSPEEYASLELE